MKKPTLPLRPALRPLVYSLIAAFPLAAAESASAKFADIPPHLQNKTETVGGRSQVKPNVMLFIDDSGSMDRTPNDKTPARGERSRLQVTKDALDTVVRHYQDQVNWGFQTLHNNNSANYNGYTDQWNTILTHIGRLTAKGGTPTTRRYYELSKYIIDNTQYRCQKNFVVLMSDGDANGSYDANWVNRGGWIPDPNTVADRMGPKGSNNNFSDPYFGTRQGAPYRHIHHINTTGAVEIWDPVWDRGDGLRWFSQTLATKDFKPAGSAPTSTERHWDGHPQDPKDSSGASRYAKQLAETYTVGFGTSLTEVGRKYLELGASKPEYFYNATQSEDLVKAFANIFDSIEANSLNDAPADIGTAAPAVTADTASGNNAPNDAATVYLDPQSWSSQLHFYSFKADGTLDRTSYKQPSFANRKTLINTGVPKAGKQIFWAHDTAQNYADNAYFGIEGANADEWKNALIPWTIRSKDDALIKSEAAAANSSQSYRVRESGKRDLGDILDSGMSTIGDNINGRPEFLVTAANDGMVHLFQSKNDTQHPYDLKLSYIPAGMERDNDNGTPSTLAKTLKEVAAEGYGHATPHRYLVNGGFVLRRTARPDGVTVKGQQMVMFGAMGQGGRGAYALNIGGTDRVEGNGNIGLHTAETAWDSTVPLFETAKGAGNTLGYTVGTPQIGRVSLLRETGKTVNTKENTRYAAFLSSGYRQENIDDSANETALYVYDLLGQEAATGEKKGAAAGTLIRKINVDGGKGGLSGPTLLDMDFDGLVDVAYAGDRGGNMYRFDLRGENPAAWSATRIYTGSPSRPITAAPAVSRRSDTRQDNKYVVIFGTGSDIYQSDVQNKTQQAVVGIFEDLTLPNPAAAQPATPLEPVTDDDLRVQTVESRTANGKEFRFLSNNTVGDKKGWIVKLGAADGERVVVKPTMILRTAVLSTRIYDAKTQKVPSSGDVCLPEQTTTTTQASSWILAINAETGGALSKNDGRVDFVSPPASPFGLQYVANGEKQNKITSFTYVDPVQLATNSAVTLDGDSGGNGTDGGLGKKRIPRNQCFSKASGQKLVTNQGGTFGVSGRGCGITRLSWREIF